MISTEIRTDRLLLRAVQKDDVNAFSKWLTDPEVMKYELTAAHTDIQQTNDFVENIMDTPYNGVLEFSVCLADTTVPSTYHPGSSKKYLLKDNTPMTVIGRAAIREEEEIEFMLSRQYWGKGFALEMVDALLKHFWSTFAHVGAVKADVDPRNERSLRLLARLGFVETGRAKKTFTTHMGWCDSVYLEVRRPVG